MTISQIYFFLPLKKKANPKNNIEDPKGFINKRNFCIRIFNS